MDTRDVTLFPRFCNRCGEQLRGDHWPQGSHFTGVRWDSEAKTSLPIWSCEPNPDLVATITPDMLHTPIIGDPT